ncbi:alkaline phosphatase D family protein [Marinicella meishanensis]|uniref:alkaline phosphatase D family protein n=1 Tax=Marinicella meishanensis TaxID=2873263 RepID=UPI001CC1491F|nr:alkaline phosphatase D family protein [Marinicella sp. NBU2979]
MHRFSFTFCLVGWLLVACGGAQKPGPDPSQPLQVIAMGSCNKEYLDQSFWPVIAEQQPDLWIWLGDNIYADTEDMAVMAAKYQRQKENPHYQSFIHQVPVIGIWDDHDYGQNDGNRTYPKKHEAKEALLSFLDVSAQATVRNHPGVYQSHTFGTPPRQVKILLLDTRSFQDPLQRLPKGGPRNYAAQADGDLLGDAQWQWLADELQQSTANINLIASSIQVIAEDHRYEMWANFPQERVRLLNLIRDSGVNNPVIISGDRHLSEVSRVQWQGQNIIEVTASGMTHSFSGNQEFNRHRWGQLITDESFSTLTINWESNTLHITQIDMAGNKQQQLTLSLQ